MDNSLLVGILGSCILVAGSAWPEHAKTITPHASVKNWLFAIGGVAMLIYAILQYQNGGHPFFIFLQSLIVAASILMMIDTNDTFDIMVLTLLGVGLVVWSLFLFDDYFIITFIVGLIGIGLGYTLKAGSIPRNATLYAGSACIAMFSFHQANWVFFWLNVFFFIFSGYYCIKMISQRTMRG